MRQPTAQNLHKSVIKYSFHQRSSLHFTSLHSTSLYVTPHFHFPLFWTLHFSSLIITYLPLFLKMCDLQARVASASAGSWLHRLIVLFTKGCLPISVLCFLSLILRSWSSLLRQQGPCNLSFAAVHAHSRVNALKRAQMRPIFLRCAMISQTESFKFSRFLLHAVKSVCLIFPVWIQARSPVLKNRGHYDV